MIQIPLTKGYTAIVDDEDAHLAGLKWHAKVDNTGTVYARRTYVADGKKRTAFLHRMVFGLAHGDGKIVDHINGDGLDCRRSNLRVATSHVNLRNLGHAFSSGSTGILGVSLRNGRWHARMKFCGQQVSLGWFPTAEQANLARLTYEKSVWGIQPRRRAAFEAAGLS